MIQKYSISKEVSGSIVKDDKGGLLRVLDVIEFIEKVHYIQGARNEDKEKYKNNPDTREAFSDGYIIRGIDFSNLLIKELRK